jgi:hypothetical protein
MRSTRSPLPQDLRDLAITKTAVLPGQIDVSAVNHSSSSGLFDVSGCEVSSILMNDRAKFSRLHALI